MIASDGHCIASALPWQPPPHSCFGAGWSHESGTESVRNEPMVVGPTLQMLELFRKMPARNLAGAISRGWSILTRSQLKKLTEQLAFYAETDQRYVTELLDAVYELGVPRSTEKLRLPPRGNIPSTDWISDLLNMCYYDIRETILRVRSQSLRQDWFVAMYNESQNDSKNGIRVIMECTTPAIRAGCVVTSDMLLQLQFSGPWKQLASQVISLVAVDQLWSAIIAMSRIAEDKNDVKCVKPDTAAVLITEVLKHDQQPSAVPKYTLLTACLLARDADLFRSINRATADDFFLRGATPQTFIILRIACQMNEPEIVKTVIRELGMNLAVAPFELSAENFGAAFTIPDMIAAGRTSVETISALLDAGADLRSLAIRAMESRSNGCVTLLDALWKTRGIGPDALTNPPSQSLARTYVKVLWDETPIIAHSVLKRFVESGILLDDKNVYTLMRCAKTHALQASAVYGIVRRGCVAKMLAVLEGLHPRLGANSSVAVVPIPCIRDIYALVLAMFMHMLGDARRKCYGQVRRKKSP